MIKHLTQLLVIAGVMGLSTSATSQDYFQSQDFRQNQNLSAGIKLNIPFGQQKRRHAFDGAKIGFAVSVNRDYSKTSYQPRLRDSRDLINFGLRLDDTRPEFKFAEQDVTAQFLGAAYANAQDDEGEEGKTKPEASNAQIGTALLLGVVVVGGGAFLIVNEAFDDL